MQQYFIDKEIKIGDAVLLDSEILFHLRQVLRKKNAYTFRLVDAQNNLFLAELSDDKAIIKERLEEDRELDIDVTIIVSLIKNDKFDFCLQKLTELGVTRIVPYEASRSIIKIKDKKANISLNIIMSPMRRILLIIFLIEILMNQLLLSLVLRAALSYKR